ncbi:MAG: ATP-binding cassette domain-containing protein [Bifidobacterium tibiigranuli]|jgi:ABC-type lipoprotein export system ATPase subunit|uniref:ATP-binding cassette domain-containing protein n=1 Tax=Bifidobacterium tibiigranuli TaxID=2172043 RepID=UPI002356759B|nr:ATP-binding cassette domain-containing protein [Bifidobacterium tibiigranuli]MCH3975758.1 ATP-binding cassette domain-containing protein [Bifidobacterium tibiigranuli]MCH4189322.1 ATP-binding cassette domain-containing protein [Bifidobacterium tibiigranuli]MCH4203043.1 ATP-binding cassette domain-containing protein [Bifidobacterium tibiigranuli]MCH4274808.1 ATP-binding cassette domain-containing protein [Bifidobacterium tibiigranuli]
MSEKQPENATEATGRENPEAVNDTTERDMDMSDDNEARELPDESASSSDGESETVAESRTVQFSVVFDDDEDGDFAVISGDGGLSDDDNDDDNDDAGSGLEADSGAATKANQLSNDIDSSDAQDSDAQHSAAQNADNHSAEAVAKQDESGDQHDAQAADADAISTDSTSTDAADDEASENAEGDVAALNAAHVEATLGLAQSQANPLFADATTQDAADSTSDSAVAPTERIASRLDKEIVSRRDDAMLLKSYPNFALDHLTVTNRKSGRSVLDDVDMAFHAGKLYAVFVDDEEQRTALMSVMGGFTRASSGQVLLKSANINELEIGEIRGHRVGMIPQRFALRGDLDAVANLVYAMDASGRTFLKPRPQVARDLLSRVGCEDIHAGVPVRELPAVDQRRMAIARAISCEASVIIIDGPTLGLDDAQSQDILSLLTTVSRSRDTRRSVIMLTSSDADCDAADIVYDVDE